MVRQYNDYDFKVEESFKEKDETKEERNDNNLTNEIMLSNMVNNNVIKHESVAMPGIFIVLPV